MNFLLFLLAPFVSFFTFWRDWARGFTIAEILNRRLDFIATNILVTSFLTGFRPLVFLSKRFYSFLLSGLLVFSNLKSKKIIMKRNV